MRLPALVALFLLAVAAAAQPAPAGHVVTGAIVDAATKRPVEYATVVLKNKASGEAVRTAVTDAKGAFALEGVPVGAYEIVYGILGSENPQRSPVTIDPQRASIDLGRLTLHSVAVKMEKVEVQAKQPAFLNSIDRKVYNVGKEIQSATGTASDLLQNIPSVQVDIDGNVSLRGSDNVLILVNGRTSALMGRSRAEVLQQLPADSIEKIEVITNPSAKYKPDGTAGIINLALKRKHEPGFASVLNVAYGNEDRSNASLSATYNPGKYNLFASYSVRQDDRERTSDEHRTVVNPVTGASTILERRAVEHARPFSRIARGGVDYAPDDANKLGLTGSTMHRTQVKRSLDRIATRDGAGTALGDSDRTRYDPEFEEKSEVSATFQHKFPKEEQELNLEVKASRGNEVEENHYGNIFRLPPQPALFDNTRIAAKERNTEAIAEYVHPLDEDSKLEAGYTFTADRLDADFHGEFLDPASGRFIRDAAKSNRFRHEANIHAFYVTYGRTWGKLGLLAGLRPEVATTTSKLVDTGARIPNDYTRVYPTLHLAYKLTERHELQANYSHRVHRPDADELNPFPEYADPFNLHAGNPRLQPEDIHSFEAGYAFRTDDVNLTSTVYHRYLYHGFTSVTRDLGNSVLFTTRENLSVSRSTGVEFTATADLGKRASLNFSSNTFFNTLDASNLGFSSSKSDISWMAKLGGSFRFSKETLVQVNTGYNSSRLTPQGSRRPSGVVNVGARRDFWQRKAAVVVTVSDLFNTMRESTRLDTPLLQQDVVRRRSPRIFYVGFIYNFGKTPKKPKDDGLKFDNTI